MSDLHHAYLGDVLDDVDFMAPTPRPASSRSAPPAISALVGEMRLARERDQDADATRTRRPDARGHLAAPAAVSKPALGVQVADAGMPSEDGRRFGPGAGGHPFPATPSAPRVVSKPSSGTPGVEAAEPSAITRQDGGVAGAQRGAPTGLLNRPAPHAAGQPGGRRALLAGRTTQPRVLHRGQGGGASSLRVPSPALRRRNGCRRHRPGGSDMGRCLPAASRRVP